MILACCLSLLTPRSVAAEGTCQAIALGNGQLWAGYNDRVELWTATAAEPDWRPTMTLPLPAPVRGLLAVGAHAVALCGAAGAVWLNAPAPVAPHWLPVPPPAQAAAERNGLLALASAPADLWLFRVTDAAAPRFLGGFAGLTDVRALGFVASLLCVADGTNGLKFLDVSIPAQPELVGVYAPPDSPPADFLAISTTLIVTAHGRQLRLLDASDPRQPVLMATHEAPAPLRGLAVAQLRLWVACGEAGLLELDLIHALKELARHPGRGPAQAVAAEGRRVFVAEGEAGWREVAVPAR